MPGTNGLAAKCYTDDEGVGVGAWDDANECVQDITVNQTRNSNAVKKRGSGEEKHIRGLRVRSIDVMIIDDPTEAFFTLCAANFESDDPSDYFGIAVMNGPLPAVGTDSRGLQMDVVVTEFGQPQPLEDVWVRKIKLVPADASDHEPAEATVAVV